MTTRRTADTTHVASPVPTDAELLVGYFQQGSQEAFRNLVRRHAPMVCSVCRQILRNEPDIQDACQATFIVLVRRGMALRRSSSLAGWLHRVAYRIACQQLKSNRRVHSEVLVDAAVPDCEVLATISRQEEASVLHEELAKLPRRYRDPILLHYFEALRRDVIAERLDTTDAAIKARLAKGRRLLRSRLMRRGVGLAVALEMAMRECRAIAVQSQLYVNDLAERVPLTATERCESIVTKEIRQMQITILRRAVVSVALVTCLMLGWGATWRGTLVAAHQETAAAIHVSITEGDGQQESTPPVVQIAEADDRGEDTEIDFEPRPLPTIRAGDVLGISVPSSPVDQPVQGTYEVEPSGTVALGAIYGRVAVGGLNAVQAEKAIAQGISSFLPDPKVSVTYGSLPGNAPPRERASDVLPAGPLQVGENLRIRVVAKLRVFADETAQIDASGEVIVPFIFERVPAASLQIKELEAKIHEAVPEGILETPWRVLVTRVADHDDEHWRQETQTRLERIEDLLRSMR